MNTQDKVSWIFNYLRQKTKNNIVVIKETETNTYFKVGHNPRVLDLYIPTIAKIETISGLISESLFHYNDL